MYKDTVTIFNRYEGTSGLEWKYTILRGVDVNADKARLLRVYGENLSDSASLHIRYGFDASGNIEADGKRYALPKEYSGAANSFTMRSGKDFDFVYVGEYVPGTGESLIDSAYKNGFFDAFKRAHEGVYKITKVARYSVIPHFEVMME